MFALKVMVISFWAAAAGEGGAVALAAAADQGCGRGVFAGRRLEQDPGRVAIGFDQRLAALAQADMRVGQVGAAGRGQHDLDRIVLPARIVLGRADAGANRIDPVDAGGRVLHRQRRVAVKAATTEKR